MSDAERTPDAAPVEAGPDAGTDGAAVAGEVLEPVEAEGEVVDAVVIEGIEATAERPPTPHDLGLELPDDRAEAEALLLQEIAAARQEAGEYLDTLQRVAAEFDNFRKRTLRDQAENIERASQRVIEHLIPTLDNFDAALAYEVQTPTEEKILEGMRGTYDLLVDALRQEGFEPIPALGEAFDPAVHEAVSGPSEPGDGDLVIAQELRRGYRMKGRVIRPSLVVVEHA